MTDRRSRLTLAAPEVESMLEPAEAELAVSAEVAAPRVEVLLPLSVEVAETAIVVNRQARHV